MITHKFREVMAFADEVTILRRGRLAGHGQVERSQPRRHGAHDDRRRGADACSRRAPASSARRGSTSTSSMRSTMAASRRSRRVALGARRRDRRRRRRLRQRPAPAGRGARRPARGRKRQDPYLHGEVYHATRGGDAPAQHLSVLPEEPLRNACVGAHERRRQSRLPRIRPARRSRPAAGGCNSAQFREEALRKIERYGIKTRSPTTRRSANCPAATCSAPCWRASSAATSRC